MSTLWAAGFLGAPAVLPLAVLVFGLVLRLDAGVTWASAVTVGIAFLGMAALFQAFAPDLVRVAEDLRQNTGIARTSVDLGWTVAATIAWTWPFAIAMFPLQIGINVLMVSRGWSRCINVDLWNVWHKACIAAFAAGMFGDTKVGLAIGCALASLWIVLELLTGDRTREQVYCLTQIPGIAVPHAMFLDAIWMAPALDLMDRVRLLDNWNGDAASLYAKLGVLTEKHVTGMVFGILFALLAGYSLGASLVFALQCAAALTLFPVVAGFLSRALAPFTVLVQSWLQTRFQGQALCVGLDWPVLSGVDAANWTRCALQVPALLVGLVLPGNTVLPLAGAGVGSAVTTAAVLTRGNLPRTVLLSLLSLPIHLWSASYFAPHLTRLAQKSGLFGLVPGQVAWLGTDGGGMRLLLFAVLEMSQRQMWTVPVAVVVISLLVRHYLRSLERREKTAAAHTGGMPVDELGT